MLFRKLENSVSHKGESMCRGVSASITKAMLGENMQPKLGIGIGKLKLDHVPNLVSNNHGIPPSVAIANNPFSETSFPWIDVMVSWFSAHVTGWSSLVICWTSSYWSTQGSIL